jgi:hypothetical protein
MPVRDVDVLKALLIVIIMMATADAFIRREKSLLASLVALS